MVVPVHFDKYAQDYDEALNQGLSITGEKKDYFAHRRISWLAECLRKTSTEPRQVMDYGCGNGSSVKFLLDLIRAESVIGLDSSGKSVELARQRQQSRAQFFLPSEYVPQGAIDLVYCNGVFHHIRPENRCDVLTYIWRSLTPGGIFALWENNPWNPGTKYVMSRIPFDRDAVTLSPPAAKAMLTLAGFHIMRVDFLFLFPRALNAFRWLEPKLSRLPLGAQYQVLAVKRAER